MMRRLVPQPALSLALFVLWLLLVNTLSTGHVVLAALLALALPQVMGGGPARGAALRHPWRLAGYVLLVLGDIVLANLQVARVVLFLPRARIRPAWIAVPVDLASPEAIALLAGTITMTPGTVTADMAGGDRVLLIHALHAPDPEALRHGIKSRYEARLKRIFEE